MARVVKCPYIAPKKGKTTYACNMCNFSNIAMRGIENFIADILQVDYKVDFDVDGVLVHWTLGVFIDYFASIKGDGYTDVIIMERIAMASISIVAKFCHDETWQSYLKIVYNSVNSNRHTLKQLITVELDIITTISLIPCFQKYCPKGYALIKLKFVKVDEALTLEALTLESLTDHNSEEKKNCESA